MPKDEQEKPAPDWLALFNVNPLSAGFFPEVSSV
jgi:hypothetical protein